MNNRRAVMICDKYYKEALSFWHCGKVAQSSGPRLEDEQLLSSPIIFLFRHSSELLIKALIIRDASKLYVADIKDIKLHPHNNKLSSMHSLKELYDTWTAILASMIVPPIDIELNKKICAIIAQEEKYDSNSTFFRYPYDRKGNENKKNVVTRVDKRDLMTVPCSIGAVMAHEGVKNFSRWRGDNKIARLEIDLDKLVVIFICLFNGIELSKFCFEDWF